LPLHFRRGNNNNYAVKILAADDHALIRDGLNAVLQRLGPDVSVLPAASCAEIETLLASHPDIDLLVLDLRLADGHGFDLLPRLTHAYPHLPIVVLSGHYETETVTRAIHLGAAGFVPKTAMNDVLVSALQLVLAGGIYVPPEVLTAPPPAPARSQGALPGLTERQMDVLSLLLEGKSNKAICRDLGLAEATVKVHVRAILRALDARSRTEAVIAANRLGLAPQPARSR